MELEVTSAVPAHLKDTLWCIYRPDDVNTTLINENCYTADDLADLLMDDIITPSTWIVEVSRSGETKSTDAIPLQAHHELWAYLLPSLLSPTDDTVLGKDEDDPSTTTCFNNESLKENDFVPHEPKDTTFSSSTLQPPHVDGSEALPPVGEENREIERLPPGTHSTTTSSSSCVAPGESGSRKRTKRTRPSDIRPATEWFQLEVNTNVYVTGLPSDVTKQELFEHFSRAGTLRLDQKGEPKVKIYAKGLGDALVSFAQPQSVGIACEYLDGSVLRPGVLLHVEPAQFQQKEGTEYLPRAVVPTTKATRKPHRRADAGCGVGERSSCSAPLDGRILWIHAAKQFLDVASETASAHNLASSHSHSLSGEMTYRARCKVVEGRIRLECEKYGTVEQIKCYRKQQAFSVLLASQEEAQRVRHILSTGHLFPDVVMYTTSVKTNGEGSAGREFTTEDGST